MSGPVAGQAGCRVCGSPRVHELFPVHGVVLRHCDACGVSFSPPEDEHDDTARYGAGYFTGTGQYRDYLRDEATHRRQARRYLRRLRRAGFTGGRLLDVGCAAGFFLDEARRAGWTVRGVEVSPYASAVARDRFALDVEQASFLDAHLDGAQFDVVTFFNVFEHLERPADVAARLGAIVRPGGMVLIETWDPDSLVARALGRHWHQWDPRFVPYYYSVRTLGLIFDARQWRVKWWSPSAKWISVGRACEIVAGGLKAGALRRLLERAAVGLLCEVDLPYFAGDLVVTQLLRL